jgi:hypothetical protein
MYKLDYPKLPPPHLMNQMKTLFEKFEPYVPLLTIGIPSYKKKGLIEIIVAGYDGTKYVENQLKQLGPGDTFACNSNTLKPVPDFNPNIGTFLLVRVISPGEDFNDTKTLVEIVNRSSQELNIRTGYPEVFPWWGGNMNIVTSYLLLIPFLIFMSKGRQVVLWFTEKKTP